MDEGPAADSGRELTLRENGQVGTTNSAFLLPKEGKLVLCTSRAAIWVVSSHQSQKKVCHSWKNFLTELSNIWGCCLEQAGLPHRECFLPCKCVDLREEIKHPHLHVVTKETSVLLPIQTVPLKKKLLVSLPTPCLLPYRAGREARHCFNQYQGECSCRK